MKLTKIYSLTAALLVTFSCSSIASSLDERLVGNWQGQRDEKGKCSFMAWKVNRSQDGTFEVSFFSNSEKTKLLNKEKGRWETKDGKLSMITEGVPTPDVYTYSFIDKNTAKFSNIERDPSADCMDDYDFVDHRVTP